MENIDKIIQVVEKIEQDSVHLNETHSAEKISSQKDFAIMTLASVKMAKDDLKNISYSKVYNTLEKKLIDTISRLERL